MAQTEDNAQSLLRKIVDHAAENEDSHPYVFVVHSTSSNSRKRRVAAEPCVDPHLYERAGIKTPQETSRMDIQGPSLWMKHLCQSVPGNVVWLATTPANRREEWLVTAEKSGRIAVVDCSRGPSGWEDQNEAKVGNLSTLLDKLKETILEHSRAHDRPISVFFDSCTLLILNHDSQKVLQLLRDIVALKEVALVTVHLSELSLTQHEIIDWQDQTQAWLHVDQGTATVIRHGVREKSNVVRQEWPYRITQNHDDGTSYIELDTDTSPTASSKEDSSKTTASRSKSRAKVELKLEEEGRTEGAPRSTDETPTPRIIVDDEDPEYADYDEEDPDDDLDI